MVKTYKNIKEIAYRTVLGGLLLLNVATTSLAQEGTIEEKVNGEISNQQGVSDQIKETEKSAGQPEYFEKLSNQINSNVNKDLENMLEIGGIPAYKEITKGHEICYLEGFEWAFLKLKLGKNIPLTPLASINYGIEQGYEEVRSIINFDSEFMKKYMIFFRKTIEKTKEGDTYVYVPTNIENINSYIKSKEE